MEEKEKIKVVSLISDADRRAQTTMAFEMPEKKEARLPQKSEIRQKALEDILRRIKERDAAIK